MFEDAELGHTVSKEEYAKRSGQLRDALLQAQYALKDARKFPVIVLIGGVEGGGRGETVNALTSWMDPRHIEVNGIGDPSDEELERPRFWRFWRSLPPKGKIGIFFGSWYTWPIINSVMEEKKPHWARLERRVSEVNRFEQMLANEGALILKFWFHLSKKAQRKRLKELKKDPLTRWRVTAKDESFFERYDRFVEVSAAVLGETSPAHAPWVIVEGVDRRYRELTVAQQLHDALTYRLANPIVKPELTATPDPSPGVDARRTVLSSLDMKRKLAKAAYDKDLEKWQGRIAMLARHKRFAEKSVVVVFEGNDAAGKGGAIRRVAGAFDARMVRVIPIAAPSDEEKSHPYLWRFWRHLPRHGNVAVFDRSWYGRVLVERVEKFCSTWDWQRAYGEINDFEEEMTGHGIVVVKFWLAITKQEQLKRFKEREAVSFKQFKITEEDWRNRKKWDAYSDAVCDMVTHTSTTRAPWTLVEANDKHFARIKVLKTLHDSIERVLG
jgi:polyphosphate:AMP phosphotransferase